MENQIIGLRYAYFLVKNHNYKMLTISQMSDELYLINPAQDKYPVIRLDFKGLPLSANKIALLKQFMANQQAVLRGSMNLTSISFGGESESYENHEVIAAFDGHIESEEIHRTFKDIDQVSWQVDNPETELREIVAKLNRLSQKQVQRQTMWTSLRESKAVLLFVSFGVIFFILTTLLNTLTHNSVNSMIILGGFYKPFIVANMEIGRFITGGFLHSNVFHLLTNMLALINVGIILERVYGSKKVTFTLLLSIIFGHLFVFIGEAEALTIGMSGGIYGLFGLLLVYFVESGLVKQPAIRTQLLLIIGINLMLNFMPNVSWLGHLGGLVAGVLLGLVYSRAPRWRTLRQSARPALGLLVVMLVFLSFTRAAPTKLYPGTDAQVLMELEEHFNATWYTEPTTDNLFELYESRGLLE